MPGQAPGRGALGSDVRDRSGRPRAVAGRRTGSGRWYSDFGRAAGRPVRAEWGKQRGGKNSAPKRSGRLGPYRKKPTLPRERGHFGRGIDGGTKCRGPHLLRRGCTGTTGGNTGKSAQTPSGRAGPDDQRTGVQSRWPDRIRRPVPRHRDRQQIQHPADPRRTARPWRDARQLPACGDPGDHCRGGGGSRRTPDDDYCRALLQHVPDAPGPCDGAQTDRDRDRREPQSAVH